MPAPFFTGVITITRPSASRSILRSGNRVERSQCPNCGEQHYAATGIVRYFHLFWIPVFPESKKVFLTCGKCRFSQEEKDISGPQIAQLKRSLFGRGKMLPMYAGTFFFLIVVALALLSEVQTATQEKGYLEDPQVADLYVANLFKVLDGADLSLPYAVLRIIAVSGETVECQVGLTKYALPSGPAKDIESLETDFSFYYEKGAVRFRRDELLDMMAEGAILEVHRPSD